MNSSQAIHHECPLYAFLGGRLQQPSSVVQIALTLNITINIFTFPFTVVLNALVIIAVKTKRRLRAHKSNFMIALLATTDFPVGIFVQPMLVAWLIAILLNVRSKLCPFLVFRLVISCLVGVSLIHLLVISMERYLAVKHPFVHISVVRETNLLLASFTAWLFSVIFHLSLLIVKDITTFHVINNAFTGSAIAFTVLSHLTVYRESLRHKKQIAGQQVTPDARKKSLRDQRAFKVTTQVITILLLCYVPTIIGRIVTTTYRSRFTLEAMYIIFFSILSISLLNSFINPILYAVKMREFRAVFMEIMCKKANIPNAESIAETRVITTSNAVIRLHEQEENKELDQENIE